MSKVGARLMMLATQAGFWVVHRMWTHHKQKRKLYYVVVERSNIPEHNDVEWEDVVIGPFASFDVAMEYANNSMDVLDWCYGEAKNKGYNVDDVYVTDKPIFPSYGVNAPIFDRI